MTSALDGIVVVDTSASMAGSVASSFLADFGARVLLVEPPGGSPLRGQPAWPFWGRGKESMVLDLSRAEGRDALAALGRAADVLIETWRPGVAERLGVGDDDLRPANPGLVYASVTGFGRGNPLSGIKGYEPIVMAKIGGLSSFATLSQRRGPSFVSTPYCSFSAGHLAVHGILAALVERESSGLGQRVDTTLVQGVAAHDPWNWLLQVLIRRYDQAYAAAPVWDEERLAPNAAIVVRLMIGLSADGRWMQFSQTTDKLWAAFLRATDLEWTRTDDRLAEGPASEDLEVRAEFWDLALAAVRTKTYDEWLAVFDEEPDVWAEVFREGTELLHHPQLVADGRITCIDDPAAGPVEQPGPLAALAATPARLGRPAPALGALGTSGDPKLARLGAHTAPDRANFGVGEGLGAAPLAGITVLEMGTFFAAPFGATILAELGARVIKLEQLEGDPVRKVMPFPEISGVKVLQGKQSAAVDVGTPEGRAVALDLATQVDAVLLAFRGGVAERLHLGPDELRAVNPSLVVLEAPGYGTGPPHGHRPAFAPTMGAGSGLAFRNLASGVPSDPLALSSDGVKREAIRLSAAAMAVAQADGFSAMVVASTLLLGLLVRKRQGIGQAMSTSMLSTMAHVLSETMVDHPGIGSVRVADADLLGLGPWYRLYRCAEGWVFLAAPEPADQAAVREELGVDLPAEEEALTEALTGVFAERPASEWEARLTALDVACVEVAGKGIEQTVLFGDLGRELDVVVDAHHPVIEDHPRLGPLVRFSRSQPVVAAPSPLCGDDTDEVLEGFGYGAARRAELRASGVIA